MVGIPRVERHGTILPPALVVVVALVGGVLGAIVHGCSGAPAPGGTTPVATVTVDGVLHEIVTGVGTADQIVRTDVDHVQPPPVDLAQIDATLTAIEQGDRRLVGCSRPTTAHSGTHASRPAAVSGRRGTGSSRRFFR